MTHHSFTVGYKSNGAYSKIVYQKRESDQ